jgi:hypothetical protein
LASAMQMKITTKVGMGARAMSILCPHCQYLHARCNALLGAMTRLELVMKM